MNINEKLNEVNTFVDYVKTCKEAMRQALIGQEQVVSEEATLDTYADYISAIEGGGGVTVYTVQYLDWDGTVLKSQEVLPDGDVLPPANPSRESYNFIGWSGTSHNVQSNLTITAQYEYAPNVVCFVDYNGKIISTQNVQTGQDAIPPAIDWGNVILDSWGDYTNIQSSRVVLPIFHLADDKTYVTLTLDESTGLTPDFYFWISSGTMSIEWGDGATGQANYTTHFTHTYPQYGTYTIALSSTGSASIGYAPSGLGGWIVGFPGAYAASIRKVLVGTTVSDGANSFNGSVNLSDVAFYKFSSYATAIKYKNCTSLGSVLLPGNVTALDGEVFSGCSNLKTVIITSPLLVTLNNLAIFSETHPDLKIYVPDNLVDSYKAASGWSVIAEKIHPLTDLANG